MTQRRAGKYAQDPRGLNDRLLSVEARLDRLEFADILRLAVRYVEPDKPRDGHIVYADGTEWDPGSGKGLYVYDSSAAAWDLIVNI